MNPYLFLEQANEVDFLEPRVHHDYCYTSIFSQSLGGIFAEQPSEQVFELTGKRQLLGECELFTQDRLIDRGGILRVVGRESSY